MQLLACQLSGGVQRINCRDVYCTTRKSSLRSSGWNFSVALMTLNNEVETRQSTDYPESYRQTLLPWFALICALFIGARLWRLTSSCLWFDEIFSVHAARHSWSNLLYFVAADIIHPPFFYVLLKIWIGLGGESVSWLRSLPVIFGIASILPFTLLCRELKLKTAEINLALLLLAVNGYLIKYAQEVRMYSLLFFLSLCSIWLFFRLFNRGDDEEERGKKTLAALCLINLVLVYTHYAGWLVVGLEAVVLLLWQRRRLAHFLFTIGLLLVAYLPWVYEVIKVAGHADSGRGIGQNIGWVTRPGLFDLAQYFVLLNRPFLFVQSSTDTGFNLVMAAIAFILFGLPLLALFLDPKNKEPKDVRIYALIVFFLAPVILAFVLSWVSPYSVWGTRHLSIAAGPYAILAAVALRRLQPHWIRITVLAVLGSWLLLSAAVFLFSRPPNFIWCSWQQLAAQMSAAESNSSGPVQVYAYEDLVAYHLWFALESPDNKRFKVAAVKNVPGITEDPAYFLPRAFTGIAVQKTPALAGDKVWVAFRSNQWDETRPPLDGIKGSGYQVGRSVTVKAQGQQAFLVELLKARSGP